MFNKKILIIAAVSLAALTILGFIITTYITRKDNIQILVAPQNAIVKLDDKPVQANKPFYVAPGKHTLLITADKFTSIKEDLTVTDTYQGFAYCLVPAESDAENYKSNPDNEYICEAANGQAYLKESQAAIDKYPVIAKLPYEDGTFKIGQGVTEENEVAIYVHYSSAKSKSEALDWIHRHQRDNLPPIIYTDDYEQTDRIGGIDSPLDKILVGKYPIVKDLPVDGIIFKLGYRIDESDASGESIKLTIAADSPQGRMAALREIKAHNTNPLDYKIEFTNFESDVKL